FASGSSDLAGAGRAAEPCRSADVSGWWPIQMSHGVADEIRINLGGIVMLLDQNKFVVKSQSKAFSSKKAYEIADGDTGQLLGTAKDITGFLASLLGSVTIEVRDASDNALLFSVGRTGLLFKKDQVLDRHGQVVGRYKAKKFSLS